MDNVTITVGSTLKPLLARFVDDDGESIDITSDTVTFKMIAKSDGSTKVSDQSATNEQAGDGETAITAITNAHPAVVTSASHGLSNTDRVLIHSVQGMDQLNHKEFTVANVTTNTFELKGIDSTSYGTYVSGGIASTRGMVSYAWQAADVDTAGIYYGQFRRVSGSDDDYAPIGKTLRIEFVAAL